MLLLSMIKYLKFLGARAAEDTGAINCDVSLPPAPECLGRGLPACHSPHYQGVFQSSVCQIFKVYSTL